MQAFLERPRLRDVLKTKPMKFQFEGIRYLFEHGGRVLLADDMGLGKSLQALGWAAIVTDARPLLIVAPANGKFNWEEEIEKHTYMKCQVLEGRKPYPIRKKIAIINYDILQYWEEALLDWNPRAVIIDECQYIKTRGIERTRICKKLSKRARHLIGMSGTPILNRPVEFFPILNMIRPNEFKSFWRYAFRYCDPKRGWRGRGWNFTGATNIKELRSRIKPFMIRRMKDDVLEQLPKKRRIPLIVPLNNRREYAQATNDFLSWYKDQMGMDRAERAKKAIALVRIGQLKRLAAEGKLKSAFQWIDDFLETTNEKLVLFVHHKSIFQALWKRYRKIAARGKLKGRKRQIEINRFQNNKNCRLYIGSTKADGSVITLTAAATVLFLELGWTPGEHDQAEDRIRRIGQKAKKIKVYYMLAHNTIDQSIWDLIESKREIISRILDGEERGEIRINIGKLVRSLTKK